jgi:hypothetical protein
MAARAFSALVILAFVGGCQSVQTQKRTNDLMTTVPDLYGQQIVDNIAMLYDKPCGMPFFGLPAQGTETNTRLIQGSFTPTFENVPALEHLYAFTVQGSAQNATAFQLQPLTNPERLTLIQIALRWAMGDTQLNGAEKAFLIGWYQQRRDAVPIYRKHFWAITHTCLDKTALPMRGKDDSETPQPQALQQGSTPIVPTNYEQTVADYPPLPPPSQVPNVGSQATMSDANSPSATPSASPGKTGSGTTTGTTSRFPPLSCPPDSIVVDRPATPMPPIYRAPWLNSSQNEHDVPKCAIYVGHSGCYWVWVCPEGRRDFADFTLAILDIAALQPSAAPVSLRVAVASQKATGRNVKNRAEVLQNNAENLRKRAQGLNNRAITARNANNLDEANSLSDEANAFSNEANVLSNEANYLKGMADALEAMPEPEAAPQNVQPNYYQPIPFATPPQ